jgi:hypothetical protein
MRVARGRAYPFGVYQSLRTARENRKRPPAKLAGPRRRDRFSPMMIDLATNEMGYEPTDIR